MDGLFIKLNGKKTLNPEQLQAAVDVLHTMPAKEFLPHAAESDAGYSIFGFIEHDAAMANLNDENVDQFNVTLLREAGQEIPRNAQKLVRSNDLRIVILSL